jgi:hypothetical protein
MEFILFLGGGECLFKPVNRKPVNTKKIAYIYCVVFNVHTNRRDDNTKMNLSEEACEAMN